MRAKKRGCLVCNKKFTVHGGAGRPGKFCSGRCRMAWSRIVDVSMSSPEMVEVVTKVVAGGAAREEVENYVRRAVAVHLEKEVTRGVDLAALVDAHRIPSHFVTGSRVDKPSR